MFEQGIMTRGRMCSKMKNYIGLMLFNDSFDKFQHCNITHEPVTGASRNTDSINTTCTARCGQVVPILSINAKYQRIHGLEIPS